MLENAVCTYCPKPIRIEFDSDKNVNLYAYDDYFSLTAHTGRVKHPDDWRELGDGFCEKRGLSLEELLSILPEICAFLGKEVTISSNRDSCPKKEYTSIDTDLCFTRYMVVVDGRIVFDKNTLYHGSIKELRDQVVSFVARLIYDHQLLPLSAAEGIQW